MEGFGDRLRDERVRRLMSQEALAEASGISVRAIRDLERGAVTRPRLSTVALLADALSLGRAERSALVEAATGSETEDGGTTPARPRTDDGLVTPRMLPIDTTDFVGRDEVFAGLDQLAGLTTAATRLGSVVSISGIPGIGKSALATHWAHTRAGSYPDGQLYLSLQGSGPDPLSARDALGQLLRALGVDGSAVPQPLEERAARFRSLGSGRRLVLVLDDAADEAQVRPLLPGSTTCVVLITSRRRLDGLEGATAIELHVLGDATALGVLSLGAGEERVHAEPEAALEIVDRCARLPLALRVASARLAARQTWPLSRMAHRLEDDRRRLDELALGDLRVRASFALSYDAQTTEVQRAFRLLGLLEQRDFPAWCIGTLVGLSTAVADAVAEALVDARLLEEVGEDALGQLRYRFHDLLRSFARERAVETDPVEARMEALRRVYTAWLDRAEAMDRRLPSPTLGHPPHGGHVRRPGSEDQDDQAVDAVTWFETERRSLVAASTHCADLGMTELAWLLAHVCLGFFALRDHHDDWRRMHEVGLDACERAGDTIGQAYLHRGLGQLAIETDDLPAARASLETATRLFREIGDDAGLSYSLMALGATDHLLAQHPSSLGALDEALTLMEERDDLRGVAHVQRDMGVVHRELGHYATSHELLGKAIVGFRATGDLRFEGVTLRSRGLLHKKAGDVDAARLDLNAALDRSRQVNDVQAIGYNQINLAELDPDPAGARARLAEGVEHARRLGNEFMEASAEQKLGVAFLADGQPEAALEHLERARVMWQSLGMPLYLARTLRDVGDAQVAGGDRPAAAASYAAAMPVLEELGAPETEDVLARLRDLGV